MKLKEIVIHKGSDCLKSKRYNGLHYLSFKEYKEDFIKPFSFDNDSTLVAVTDCNSIKVVGKRAFASCMSLVRFDGLLYSVEEEGFKFCSALKDFNFNSIKRLSDSAFAFSGLVNANFPDSLQSIPSKCFAYCLNLKNINLNKVESIESEAFSMAGLRIIELPYFLQEIGASAFESCFKLTDIICTSTNPPKLGNKAFMNTPVQNIWFFSEDIRQKYIHNRQWSKWADKMKVTSAKDLIERTKLIEKESNNFLDFFS